MEIKFYDSFQHEVYFYSKDPPQKYIFIELILICCVFHSKPFLDPSITPKDFIFNSI